MKSDPTLLKWFRKYNRRYFNGKLQEPIVCYGADMNDSYGRLLRPGILRYRIVGEKKRRWIPFKSNRPTLVISYQLKEKDWAGIAKETLLHEMAHMSIPRRFRHGPRFQKEMLRLAKAGAFKGLW